MNTSVKGKAFSESRYRVHLISCGVKFCNYQPLLAVLTTNNSIIADRIRTKDTDQIPELIARYQDETDLTVIAMPRNVAMTLIRKVSADITQAQDLHSPVAFIGLLGNDSITKHDIRKAASLPVLLTSRLERDLRLPLAELLQEAQVESALPPSPPKPSAPG